MHVQNLCVRQRKSGELLKVIAKVGALPVAAEPGSWKLRLTVSNCNEDRQWGLLFLNALTIL
jgi:hypothetical protein